MYYEEYFGIQLLLRLNIHFFLYIRHLSNLKLTSKINIINLNFIALIIIYK